MAQRVERTRGNGNYTEAEFWSMIRSALRQRSMYWKPIALCKAMAKRKYNGPDKRQKFEYQCAECSKWHKSTEVVVDHIKEVGSLRSPEDLPDFVMNLFCEVDNLQVLCKRCHQIKTNEARTKPLLTNETKRNTPNYN